MLHFHFTCPWSLFTGFADAANEKPSNKRRTTRLKMHIRCGFYTLIYRIVLWMFITPNVFCDKTTATIMHTPNHPPTTLIPHIDRSVSSECEPYAGATPKKMAPAVVDLCAGLAVLLPRQIRRFRCGFFSSAVPDWSLRSCLRVRHLRRQQIADNQRYLRRSFLPWTSSLRSQILPSKCWKGCYGKPLDEAVSNFFLEFSLSEKFGLWKITIGNHIHLNLTSMCGFSLNPPPPPPPPPHTHTETHTHRRQWLTDEMGFFLL